MQAIEKLWSLDTTGGTYDGFTARSWAWTKLDGVCCHRFFGNWLTGRSKSGNCDLKTTISQLRKDMKALDKDTRNILYDMDYQPADDAPQGEGHAMTVSLTYLNNDSERVLVGIYDSGNFLGSSEDRGPSDKDVTRWVWKCKPEEFIKVITRFESPDSKDLINEKGLRMGEKFLSMLFPKIKQIMNEECGKENNLTYQTNFDLITRNFAQQGPNCL